jgi:hypothetical protein
VKVFGKEYYDEDFTGLHIKVLSYSDNKVTLSIDFDQKPEGFIAEEPVMSNDRVGEDQNLFEGDEEAV